MGRDHSFFKALSVRSCAPISEHIAKIDRLALRDLYGRPVVWQKFADTFGRMSHETSHHVFKVLPGVDANGFAGLDYGKNDSCSFSATFVADEEPIFSSDGNATNCSLGDVIIKTGKGVSQIVLEEGYESREVEKSLSILRFGQHFSVMKLAVDLSNEFIDDWLFVLLTDAQTFLGRPVPSNTFKHEQISNLAQNPVSELLVSTFGFYKLPSNMHKTRTPCDILIGGYFHVGLVFIGVKSTLKILKKLFCMNMLSTGTKSINPKWRIITFSSDEDPHVNLFCLSVPRILHIERSFINEYILTLQDASYHLVVDWFQGLSCAYYPFAKILARDLYAVPSEDFGETIERKVIYEFSDKDFCQKAFVCEAPCKEAIGKLSSSDASTAFLRKSIFGANDLFDVEAAWSMCQLLSNLFADFYERQSGFLADLFFFRDINDLRLYGKV